MDTSRPSPIPPDTQTAVPLEMEVPTGSGIQTSVPTAARTRVPEPRSRGRRPQLAAVPPDTQSVLPYTQFTLPRSRAVRRAIRFDGSLCDDWYDSDPDKKFGWRVCFPRTDAEVPDLIPDSYIGQFISSRGNEYFCEIDEEYLTDRFNLTGLNMEVSYYQHALDLITDVFDLDADDHLREQIEKSARHLYGLVHARYIVTTRGLAKMVEKYKRGDFGKCPRVICEAQPLLPTGQSDLPNVSGVKLYCPKCEDLYNPKSSRHASIDGAYFGTTFHGMLFQVHPGLVPEKSIRRHEPKIYGFKVHALAALARWQDNFRDDMKARLKEAGVEVKYAEDSDDGEREDVPESTSNDEAKPEKKKDERAGANEKVLGDAASGQMDLGN